MAMAKHLELIMARIASTMVVSLANLLVVMDMFTTMAIEAASKLVTECMD